MNNDKNRTTDDIPLGGFAGIVEKQMVISPKLMSSAAPILPHEDIDIITLNLSGKLAHKETEAMGLVLINETGLSDVV